MHCDLWGSYRTLSYCGASYFLTIVDDYSRAVWIYLLVDKSEAPRMFKMFLVHVERQFNKHVKMVRSDNGTEFTCMKNFFLENGIIFQTSCVGTPQQNGRVERKHQHILNVGRALRFQGHLPIKFWGEYILTAGYLINRTPSSILKGKTPYEMLYGKPPTYHHLRTLGCLCFAHNKTKDKFDSRSRRCVFLGYPCGKKVWQLYDLEKHNFFVSHDVVFMEDQFPFINKEVKASEGGNGGNIFPCHEDSDLDDMGVLSHQHHHLLLQPLNSIMQTRYISLVHRLIWVPQAQLTSPTLYLHPIPIHQISLLPKKGTH